MIRSSLRCEVGRAAEEGFEEPAIRDVRLSVLHQMEQERELSN